MGGIEARRFEWGGTGGECRDSEAGGVALNPTPPADGRAEATYVISTRFVFYTFICSLASSPTRGEVLCRYLL